MMIFHHHFGLDFNFCLNLSYYRNPEPTIPEVPEEEELPEPPATGYEVPKCETVYEKR